MLIGIHFVVMTRRKPPQSDSGSWSEHGTHESAVDCADGLGGGDVYVRVSADDTCTMYKMKNRHNTNELRDIVAAATARLSDEL